MACFGPLSHYLEKVSHRFRYKILSLPRLPTHFPMFTFLCEPSLPHFPHFPTSLSLLFFIATPPSRHTLSSFLHRGTTIAPHCLFFSSSRHHHGGTTIAPPPWRHHHRAMHHHRGLYFNLSTPFRFQPCLFLERNRRLVKLSLTLNFFEILFKPWLYFFRSVRWLYFWVCIEFFSVVFPLF